LQLPARIKPTRGFSHFIHTGLNALLPILAYVLVRINLVPLAILLVILAKWRIFAVRPRYWIANIVSNGIDITVAVSFILFIASTSSTWWQIFWVAMYAGWLIYLKPRYDVLSVSIQAMIGQLLGLTVLYLKFGDASLAWLVLATWLVAYLAARHFLTSFEESYSTLIAHIWGYFGASLAFVLGHWLLFYGSIAQITVIMTTVGYGLAALYYLDASNRLTKLMQRQLIAIMLAILLVVLILSDWTGVTV
jgi:hypothetical protein